LPGLPTTRDYADRIAARLRAHLAEAGLTGTVEVIEPRRTYFELAVGLELPNGDRVGISRPAADYDNGAHGMNARALADVRRLLDPSAPEAHPGGTRPADRLTYDDVMTLTPPAPAPEPAAQPPAPRAATRRKPAGAPAKETTEPDAAPEPDPAAE
jgi:hypothetical protein